ncbi:MAG: FkbM family methyltransferase [Solirubrobacterales bacterium]
MTQGNPTALAPSAVSLDRSRVIDVETDLGSIWLERDAEMVTPELVQNGRYQPSLTALMRKALKPGMTFVDAGANIGYFSVLAGRLVGPTGRVVCVEADPGNVAILRANLHRHGATNAVVFPVAAWSERTDLNLDVNPEGGAGSSVGRSEPTGHTVSAHRLDELVDGAADFIKVDCESTDDIVISGAQGLIRANPRVLINTEFATNNTAHTGHSSEDVLATYEGLGLLPFTIRPRGSLKPASYAELLRAGTGDTEIYDFALSPTVPKALVARFSPSEQVITPAAARLRRMSDPLLERAGDMLEHVPSASARRSGGATAPGGAPSAPASG